MDNLITQSINDIGLARMAKELDISYQAIRKWERANRLPRTEWTGETNYSQTIEHLTEGRISRAALLASRGNQT